MNIEELTPEYIFNKLEEGFVKKIGIKNSIHGRENFYPVSGYVNLGRDFNRDIKLVRKRIGFKQHHNIRGNTHLFLVEKLVSLENKCDGYMWSCFMGTPETEFRNLHPKHFYIMNENLEGWLLSECFKTKKNKTLLSEKISHEMIYRLKGTK